MTNRWSPHPIERYTRMVEGTPMGPGANLALITTPGAWNVYWLTYPDLERHTDLVGTEPPLIIDPFADLVVATVNQAAGAARVGDLAMHLPPFAFIDEMSVRHISHLGLVRFMGRETWLQLMSVRAREFSGALRAECKHDLTMQENGTNSEKSTTILPFSFFLSRSIH